MPSWRGVSGACCLRRQGAWREGRAVLLRLDTTVQLTSRMAPRSRPDNLPVASLAFQKLLAKPCSSLRAVTAETSCSWTDATEFKERQSELEGGAGARAGGARLVRVTGL